MLKFGIKNPSADLSEYGISDVKQTFWNLSPEELTEETINRGQGTVADSGALLVMTGEFTGRSPKDRFVVKDENTANSVDWNNINMAFEPEKFDALYDKVANYFSGKDVFIRDAYACADEQYRLNLRLVSEYPWSNQFAYNMFLRPTEEEVKSFEPEWVILNAPGFMADAEIDGTRQHNFAIVNFTKKRIIIGGTGYTGEIKKGIFSVLNYILPKEREVLSMHCSANMGKDGDVAIFFGLSGTGKTTLSADPNRGLIGDDEHGWSENGVFNFEGGCYAKTIDLSAEKEPEIFAAIKHGAILENLIYHENTRNVDFHNTEITQNTRVSYPIHHIDNALTPSKGGHPKNIFFLTCDAFGVLPPISKLTPEQAMYYFISGYTAKVAGTEAGVVDPEATFSACFGAPFLPLHATFYAEMLGQKMQEYNTNVWLVNTGWTGGAFGTGNRIKLRYTRAMITAALESQLDNVTYTEHEVFGLNMPTTCPNVPDEVLNPRNTWMDANEYDNKANFLANLFVENFRKFEDKASEAILAASPKLLV
ncbi:MAG: phosphoenolpyruvate carboxykinase (ATP) [Bacteroidota bacterium]